MRPALRRRLPSLASIALAATAVALAAGVHARRPPPPPAACGERACGPNEVMLARLASKDRVAGEVAAGRLTLLEAAARFKAMDPDGWPYMRVDLNPVASQDEVYCRNVICWVRWGETPGCGAVLADAMEAELQARLGDGTLRLPD